MFISPFSHLIRFSAVLGVAVLSAATALAVRFGVESRVSDDRGRFVVAHIREHHAAVEKGAFQLRAQFAKSATAGALNRAEASRRIIDDLPPEQLLSESRRVHAEAAGYLRVGRTYDAAALYVASVRSLVQFIEKNSTHRDVPEALFLMGEALARLRRVYPVSLKSESVLTLCMELYPDSVWAVRARMLRNGEL